MESIADELEQEPGVVEACAEKLQKKFKPGDLIQGERPKIAIHDSSGEVVVLSESSDRYSKCNGCFVRACAVGAAARA